MPENLFNLYIIMLFFGIAIPFIKYFYYNHVKQNPETTARAIERISRDSLFSQLDIEVMERHQASKPVLDLPPSYSSLDFSDDLPSYTDVNNGKI